MTTTLIIGIFIGLLCGVSIGLWVDMVINKLPNHKIQDVPTKPMPTVPAFMPSDVSADYRKKKQEEFFKTK